MASGGTASPASVPLAVAGGAVTLHAVSNVRNLANLQPLSYNFGKANSSKTTASGSTQAARHGNSPNKFASDIEKKIKQFEKKSLRDQKSVHNTLKKTYQNHLKKYNQQPGKTTGETNRMERELEEMNRILQGRGQDI